MTWLVVPGLAVGGLPYDLRLGARPVIGFNPNAGGRAEHIAAQVELQPYNAASELIRSVEDLDLRLAPPPGLRSRSSEHNDRNNRLLQTEAAMEIAVAFGEHAEADGQTYLLHVALNSQVTGLDRNRPQHRGESGTQSAATLVFQPAAHRSLDDIAGGDLRQHHVAVVGADHDAVESLRHHPADGGRDVADNIRQVTPRTPGTEIFRHGIRILGTHDKQVSILQAGADLFRRSEHLIQRGLVEAVSVGVSHELHAVRRRLEEPGAERRNQSAVLRDQPKHTFRPRHQSRHAATCYGGHHASGMTDLDFAGCDQCFAQIAPHLVAE